MSDPGDVEVLLGADHNVSRTLRCSLQAYKAVNSLAGGYTSLMRRIADCDVDLIASIVIIGTGTIGRKKLDELEQLIYEAGVTNLAGPCMDYLSRLANGGRPVKDEDDKKDDEKKDDSQGKDVGGDS